MTTTAPPAVLHAIQKVERLYNTVTFLHWFATSMTAAVSILLARERGLTLAEIGLYTSVFAACTALLELPTGGLADNVGRKRVTLWAYWFSILSRLLLLFSVNVPLYLLYAVVAATARALGSGALEAWFLNTLKNLDPNVNLQPILARNSALTMLALGGGALCGGALPGLVHGWPFSPLLLPIVAALLAHGITFGVTWKYVQDEEPPHANLHAALRAGFTGLRSSFKSAWTLIRADQALQLLLLIELSLGVIIAATETYWQPFLTTTFHLME